MLGGMVTGGAVAPDAETHPNGSVKPSRRLVISVGSVFLILVIGVVPWRYDVIYSGGADIVVVAKAIVGLVAFLSAAILRMRVSTVYRVGLGPASLILIVASLSLLGSFISGHFGTTLVLVARMILLVGTVLLLLTCIRWDYAIGAFLTATGILAITAAVTGLGTATTGRLSGGIPQLHPNELSALASVTLIGLVVLTLKTGFRYWNVAAMLALLAIVAASGSRSPLIGLAVATTVALLTNGRLQRQIATALIAGVPAVYAALVFTDILGSIATRGGTEDAASALDSRWDAWKPVLAWPWGSWKKWIGQGLSVKEVKVDVKWLDTQVLDSSWVSLLAQAGIVGTALIALLIVWGILVALTSPQRRGLLLPLLLFVIIRSFTESGLVDSTVQLVLLLMTTSLLTGRSMRSMGERRTSEESELQFEPIFT